MATLSPPTITTTTTTHTPFLPKSPRLFSFKKSPHTLRSACTKVSCKASNNNNDDQFQLIQTPNNNTPLQFDRRNMLLGLGGVYGAAMTLGRGAADTQAAPIAPNLEACALTQSKESQGDRCCPPAFLLKDRKDFIFEEKPIVKIRRPAHLAMNDKEWLADYKRATAIMKSLPMSDPRNFIQQARVHCAYCDGAYPVLHHSDLRYEVHGGWLFAPFHRWYLYFFERILGKLIDKPDFALPYWNWDHPEGMRIPEMFKDKDSPLYNPNRNTLHQTKVIDLSYNNKKIESDDITDVEQIQQNLLLMRKQMLYPTKPSVFFGDAYRSGDKADSDKGAGALELAPHNAIHMWTGSKSVRGGQDMGAFWSAGRDPIFYCHHANVDRMWSVWRNDLPGRSRLDIDDPDYLNASFILYDEDANPVKVYVKDSLDTEKLGYKYQQQDLPWLFKTVPSPPPQKKPPTPPPSDFPKRLDSVIKTMVKRPKKSRTKAEVEAAEEVLVISMDIAMSPQSIKYDVFVNEISDPKPGDKTDVKPQFAGSFTSLGHRGSGDGMAEMTRKTEYKIALSSLLDDIGASDDDSIQVTIVPKVGAKAVVINDIKIELVSE